MLVAITMLASVLAVSVIDAASASARLVYSTSVVSGLKSTGILAGFAVGPDDTLYVATPTGLQTISGGAVTGTTVAAGTNPYGVGRASDGTLFVANLDSDNVTIIRNGVVLQT
ncbi:MAG TPA: hypothetical protein VGM93_13765, partial [Acidimicrobiales bacterium]